MRTKEGNEQWKNTNVNEVQNKSKKCDKKRRVGIN